jgi:hypothetical protein
MAGRRQGGRVAAQRRYAAVTSVWQCPKCTARLRPGESCGCWDEQPSLPLAGAEPVCVGCGKTEAQSPGQRPYGTGPWCLECRRAALVAEAR